MNYDLLLPSFIFINQLLLLLWSANKVVTAAASIVSHVGLSPLFIGIFFIGFGTSVPELFVSTMLALQENPRIALGTSYGSNIANIALVFGFTGIISATSVLSNTIKKELPILLAATLLTFSLLYDGELSRIDAGVLIFFFVLLMIWGIVQTYHREKNELNYSLKTDSKDKKGMSIKKAVLWLFLGLVFLIISSRIIVFEAVEIAQFFGLNDLIIGLTIVALGTSLPEIATSIIAMHKKEYEIAFGNILGSNLFNTLLVVGVAGAIQPMLVLHEVIYRDFLVMSGLTLSFFFSGHGLRINKFNGVALLSVYIGYTIWLIFSTAGGYDVC